MPDILKLFPQRLKGTSISSRLDTLDDFDLFNKTKYWKIDNDNIKSHCCTGIEEGICRALNENESRNLGNKQEPKLALPGISSETWRP